MWDLRNAFAPVQDLRGHTKGILAASWCPFDNGLLLSAGKDNRTLCWDPQSGAVLCEVRAEGGRDGHGHARSGGDTMRRAREAPPALARARAAPLTAARHPSRICVPLRSLGRLPLPPFAPCARSLSPRAAPVERQLEL
jgi:hypothetical protein